MGEWWADRPFELAPLKVEIASLRMKDGTTYDQWAARFRTNARPFLAPQIHSQPDFGHDE